MAVGLDVQGHLADGLGGIGMEDDASFAAQSADFRDRIDCADLVVRGHDRDQDRLVGEGFLPRPRPRPCRLVAGNNCARPSLRRASRFIGSRTALCSEAAVTRCLPRRIEAWATPLMARLFDSVAPDVKMISRASAPMARATCSRARSRASAASQPNRCEVLAALP